MKQKSLDDDIPIRELWCAVIEQAFIDATSGEDRVYKCESRNHLQQMDHASAINFFKSTFFDDLCHCLQIDPEPIKTKALK